MQKILNKIDKIDHFVYSKLQNNFISAIKAHKGSIIFKILPELIIDPYANYFCKNFLYI